MLCGRKSWNGRCVVHTTASAMAILSRYTVFESVGRKLVFKDFLTLAPRYLGVSGRSSRPRTESTSSGLLERTTKVRVLVCLNGRLPGTRYNTTWHMLGGGPSRSLTTQDRNSFSRQDWLKPIHTISYILGCILLRNKGSCTAEDWLY